MSSQINLKYADLLYKPKQRSPEQTKANLCTTNACGVKRKTPLFKDEANYESGLVKICNAFNPEDFGDRAYGFCMNIGTPVYIQGKKKYACTHCESEPKQ